MLFAVPLAGLAAHRLGRRLTTRRGLRIVWAVSYALAVVATGAVAQGRIGTVVALIGAADRRQHRRPARRRTGLAARPAPRHLDRDRGGLRAGRAPAVPRRPRAPARAGGTLGAARRHHRRDRAARAARARGSCSEPDTRSACGGRPASPCPATPPCSTWRSAAPVGPGAAPVWLGAGLLVLAVLALVPAALPRLRAGLLGRGPDRPGASPCSARPSRTRPRPGRPRSRRGSGCRSSCGSAGLLTAVMFAAPEAAGLPRQVVAVLAVVASAAAGRHRRLVAAAR